MPDSVTASSTGKEFATLVGCFWCLPAKPKPPTKLPAPGRFPWSTDLQCAVAESTEGQITGSSCPRVRSGQNLCVGRGAIAVECLAVQHKGHSEDPWSAAVGAAQASDRSAWIGRSYQRMIFPGFR